MASPHAQLQFYKDRVKELEAEVQRLKAELASCRDSPPNPPLPCSVPTRNLSSDVAFIFQVENPQQQQDNVAVRDEPQELVDLLKQVPKTNEDWSRRRKELQLFETEDVIAAFLAFVTRRQPAITNRHLGAESQSLTTIGLLEDFKAFATSLRRVSERTRQLHHFADLLFVSLCRVARKDGTPLDAINPLMDDYLPSRKKKGQERQSSHFTHLRAAVLWPIHQAELLRKKVGHRADEFFLLCMGYVGNATKIVLTWIRWTPNHYISPTTGKQQGHSKVRKHGCSSLSSRRRRGQ